MPITPSEKQSEKTVDMESDDEREEEIMKKLIAKGKVQRSGLSWFNTFVKWILDTICMNFFFGALAILWEILWESMWNRHAPSKTWSDMKFVRPAFCFSVTATNSM